MVDVFRNFGGRRWSHNQWFELCDPNPKAATTLSEGSIVVLTLRDETAFAQQDAARIERIAEIGGQLHAELVNAAGRTLTSPLWALIEVEGSRR
jgi:hypothetical protein